MGKCEGFKREVQSYLDHFGWTKSRSRRKIPALHPAGTFVYMRSPRRLEEKLEINWAVTYVAYTLSISSH